MGATIKMCGKCRRHGVLQAYKHHLNCPFVDCGCDKCFQVDEYRLKMRKVVAQTKKRKTEGAGSKPVTPNIAEAPYKTLLDLLPPSTSRDSLNQPTTTANLLQFEAVHSLNPSPSSSVFSDYSISSELSVPKKPRMNVPLSLGDTVNIQGLDIVLINPIPIDLLYPGCSMFNFPHPALYLVA
ncbi:unnamed protein product [Bursaphelenchus xylophilus]|uniref:(pine wood nematode) hypothetical protein n=1 Tax=Bursaphelenchus xylophilus TaxID=6326 RepID=A0A1I7SGA4_BURXY|nr:unnamed protein product [Bursaphelenchus xylophilus]CAG9119210.1 unnamed protein product [Bursaphelenchus xylophilus]